MTRCEELMVKGTLDNYHLLGFNPQEILFTEASTLITALKGCRALIFFFFFFLLASIYIYMLNFTKSMNSPMPLQRGYSISVTVSSGLTNKKIEQSRKIFKSYIKKYIILYNTLHIVYILSL